MTPAPDHAILSFVGGGPMERLARRMRDLGGGARVVARLAPEAYRALMASGPLGRVRARLSSVGFPARSVFGALTALDPVWVPTTNPFFLPFVLVLTRPLHGVAIVPLIYDLYPDVLEATGAAPALSPLFAAANRFVFRRADGVVFIGAGMAEHARRRYGEPRRWTVLETGADSSEFAATAPQSLDCEPWLGERLVLSYVGNLGRVHDWETLAEGLREPLETDGGASLCALIAASGPGVEPLRSALGSLEAVRFEPPLSDSAWARLLVRTDVALVSLREEAALTSIPSKTFSAMAAGCAVLAVAPLDSDLARLVRATGCGEVVSPGDMTGFAAALESLRDRAQLASYQARARQAIRELYDMPALARRWTAFLRHVVSETRPSAGLGYEAAKRTIDLLGAGVGLAASAPILATSVAAVRLTLGSPVFFRQPRIGRGGQQLDLVKLRTMREPAPGEARGPESDARRLTALGRLLRATSIDELPTLWNVLKGELSLVGPRPLLVRYLPRYDQRQARRHEVKPGVTGLAQVLGRNAISWERKFELDVDYVERRSLSLDLRILARTVWNVLRRADVNQEGHATMPEFMGTPPVDAPASSAPKEATCPSSTS